MTKPKAKEKVTRTVAIVGFAGSSRQQANKEPEETEIWGLNSGYTWMDMDKVKAHPNSRWFDIHGYEGRDKYSSEHWAKMLEMGIPIYALHPPVPLPDSVVELDYEAICKDLGEAPYFTNTIAYMIAMAVWEKVDHIKLFGVDMATGGEFEHQRPCCEYWISAARGRGIIVDIPQQSPLCRGLMYGVDRNDGFTRKVLMDTMGDVQKQEEQAMAQYHQATGGVKQLTDLVTAFTGWENDHGPITRDDMHGMISEMMAVAKEAEREHERQYYAVDGARQVTRGLLHKFFLPDMTTAEIEMPELAEMVQGKEPEELGDIAPYELQVSPNGHQEEALQNA